MRALPLVLTASLLGCAQTAPISDEATTAPEEGVCLTCAGQVLHYTVHSEGQQYPFVLTVTQNDDAGTAFAYDIAGGRNAGTVTMEPEAREAAPAGMLNHFEPNGAYVLTDQTSAWLARDAFRRMKSGETVSMALGGSKAEPLRLVGACGALYPVPLPDGTIEEVRTCLFESADASIVILDDEADPLILEMDTGFFTVAIDQAE